MWPSHSPLSMTYHEMTYHEMTYHEMTDTLQRTPIMVPMRGMSVPLCRW
jgi:hypothetical protein